MASEMRFYTIAALIAALALTAPAHAQSNAARGKQVFDHWCAPCHGAGKGKPGSDALAAKYADGSEPALLEQRKDLDPDFVLLMIRQGVSIMPIFRKTEISNADAAALTDYLCKGNK